MQVQKFDFSNEYECWVQTTHKSWKDGQIGLKFDGVLPAIVMHSTWPVSKLLL